ncbi:deoxycytidylate deaminase [Zychaea mexicana]|uniref:deoxycytidylate deaminase n=1 Tax=Zychaea mexicana TaxID=64656 RepID=UPI0022FF2D2D|nr:deoxycytidylate deaminase [Zychaea mexicana]KAI9472877.1 deoxycytidylate deaminase [Zychaea mexicana]
MFIGVVGTQCSGKHSVAEYLVQRHGFQILSLRNSVELDRTVCQTALEFSSVEEMHNYVTDRWRENFVTCDIDGQNLSLLNKRPFFLLVSVEAPLSMRYQRFIERCAASDSIPKRTLEQFIQDDDQAMYNTSEQALPLSQLQKLPLHRIISSSDITITNVYAQKCDFMASLDTLDLTDPERIRPSWDTYFMHLSDLAARRSNCMKRRVGCILVKDSRIIATGYNGTPRGLRNCNEGGCGRCNANAPCGTGLDRCLCMHAEENALLEAGRSRVDFGIGVVLYCNTCPCLGCAIKIVQIGVKEVVYSKSYGMDEMTAKVFAEANVKLRQHSPPSMRLETQPASLQKDRIIEQLGLK